MAGLGLTNALGMYQQGLGWHQQQQDRQRQQQQIAKQQERQAQLEAANKAAAGFLEQARMKAPNPDQWQPDDDTMFQAGALRSRELARAGLFDELAQNEVALEKQRMRARGSALESWRLKRDPKALVTQAYSTIPDGGTVQDVQPLDGGKRVKVKFSTGVEQEIDPEQLAGALEASLVEPGKYAEMSIRRNMEAALIEARKQAGLALAKARGDEAQETAKTKGEFGLKAAEARAGAQVKAAEVRAAAPRGGGGVATAGGPKVRSSYVDAAGNRIQQLSDGSLVNLGKDRAYQSMLQAEMKALKDTMDGMRMKPEELERVAAERVTRRATAVASSSARPPLTQFGGQPQQQPQQRPPLTNFIR